MFSSRWLMKSRRCSRSCRIRSSLAQYLSRIPSTCSICRGCRLTRPCPTQDCMFQCGLSQWFVWRVIIGSNKAQRQPTFKNLHETPKSIICFVYWRSTCPSSPAPALSAAAADSPGPAHTKVV